ncbi:MAG: NACHT domain-containing protein, partial [Proteobacteria bacterium]|nr:NACHT domain-containing protein [Pseudomonadota bacterium]
NDKTIFCFTFDELIEEHADFTRYFRWLEDFVKERGIDNDYVPLACRRDKYDQDTKEKVKEEHYGKNDGWIEGYIDRWLGDPSMEHISILGEFGTGKTWFTHHYAYLQMQKYLEAKEKDLVRPRLPLVIQLRDYSKALNSESLFSDFFFRKHEIPLPGYSAFEQLNRMGKLLLIFDGFDEMADKLDRQKMINNFWELARVVVPGAKAILTCRTEHFPNAREGRDLLNAELKASTSNLTGDPPQFEILELEKFNEEQVRDALLKRADQKTVDVIMGHTELLDLAGRPVMLEFILEALPDIEGGKPVDLSRIYLYAIQKKLERDFKSERTFTSMADKFYFMCELSWEMLTTEKMSLNYRLFPDRLRNLFGLSVSDEKDLDHWHYDMMGNTLLIRNDDGDYTPAHRSLLEFFVAFKAVAELGMLPPDFIVPVSLLSYTDNDREPVSSDWNTYFLRESDCGGEIKQVPPLKEFGAGDVDTVLATL